MSLITFEITCSSLWGSSFWGQKTVNCLDKTMRKPLIGTNVNGTQQFFGPHEFSAASCAILF